MLKRIVNQVDAMQPIAGIGRNLLRIVFRGGSPQRIAFSDGLLLSAVAGVLVSTVAVQLLFFRSSIIETGLVLFTLVCGIYLGVALLTRRVPRGRLRQSLQAELLVLMASQLLLVVLVPVSRMVPGFRLGAAIALAIVVLLGTTNVLQFARGGSRRDAAFRTLAFFAALGAFYALLRSLLETLFS